MLTNPDCLEKISECVQWVRSIEEPDLQAQAATWLMTQIQTLVTPELAAIRTRAVRQLIAQGWSNAEVGAAIGVNRQRVHQIAGDR